MSSETKDDSSETNDNVEATTSSAALASRKRETAAEEQNQNKRPKLGDGIRENAPRDGSASPDDDEGYAVWMYHRVPSIMIGDKDQKTMHSG